MKKFYSLVSIEATDNGHFRILLDGKPMKTPAQNDFFCNSEHVATLAQQEWSNQEETISPESMPVTQFISTALDRTAPNRATIEQDILAYLETDLLYFHAAEPPELVKEQDNIWSSYLTQMAEILGPLPSKTTGLRAGSLATETKEKAKSFISALSDIELTLFVHLAQSSSSFLLACAFFHKIITSDNFIKATFCEEFFYIDFYGTAHNGLDPQLQAKSDTLTRDLKAAELILFPKT
jgi:chaperone required for assembly of F1-ATPase